MQLAQLLALTFLRPVEVRLGEWSKIDLDEKLWRMGFEKDEMCAHGFRSMASTILNEQGYPADAFKKQLAHNLRNKIRSIYNRTEYLPERRKMMQEWADYLETIRQKK